MRGRSITKWIDTLKWASSGRKPDKRRSQMGKPVAIAIYVAAMVAIIVSVDIAFFRNQFWGRLMVNVGIVLVFAAFYLRFFRHL